MYKTEPPQITRIIGNIYATAKQRSLYTKCVLNENGIRNGNSI